jgi:hypothetical protein
VSGRTFVVTVSDSPDRVVVEDVRDRRRTVAPDLAAVGGEIARLIEAPAPEPPTGPIEMPERDIDR